MANKKPDLKQIKQNIQKAGSAPKEKPSYKVPDRKVFESMVFDETDLRPQQLVPKNINLWVGLALFAATLIVYMLTQARSLSFWDSGEYATCTSILGVPHPPGNPFYILFGRAVMALFGGIFPHGMIAAFLSGLLSAFAVLFTYLITVQLTSMFKIKYREAIFAGVIAALYTAFSFTFWMNAIEAEVYSGLVFFVNLIIWLTLYWVQKSRDYHHQNILLLIVYLFFLSFCVHQTSLQIAPAVLFIVVYPMLVKGGRKGNFWLKVIGYTAALLLAYVIFGEIGKGMRIDDFDKWGFSLMAFVLLLIELRDTIDKRLWFLGLALVLVGLSSHLFLMVRAADRPFINEGHPSTLKMFQDYVLRKQYGETSMFTRRGNLFTHQFGYHFLRYFGWQWFNAETLHNWLKLPANAISALGNLLIAVLGLFGAIFHFRKNKHSFFYFLSIFICTSLLMVFVMNLSSTEVRDRDYFFVVAYNMWAIWLGIGSLGLLYLFKSKAARYVLIAFLAFLPILNMVSQYRVHDRSREFIALDYGQNFLNSLEKDAIIFTNGDNDTFPIWYAQAVKDPYAKEYLPPTRDVFPTAQSKAAIATAMAFKSSELKGIRKDVTVANLSLLNTPWYIRQLRDREGVYFDWSDELIDQLQPALLGTTVNFSAGDPQGAMNFSLEYPKSPSYRNGEDYYRVADLAVIQIIKDNFGKRPIYFAVTCENYVGFDEYLRNEGMVSRVVHTRDAEGSQVDINRLINNIDKVYEYRSIHDDRVYKDDNMNRLVMNYGSGYVRAAVYYTKQGDYKRAEQYAAKARQYVDSELRMADYYIRYYVGTNQLDKLDAFIEKNIFTHERAMDIYQSYVLRYILENRQDLAPRYLGMIMQRYPDDTDLGALAISYAQEFNQISQVEALFKSLGGKINYTMEQLLQQMYSQANPDSEAAPGM